jgi:hypothetical protein
VRDGHGLDALSPIKSKRIRKKVAKEKKAGAYLAERIPTSKLIGRVGGDQTGGVENVQKTGDQKLGREHLGRGEGIDLDWGKWVEKKVSSERMRELGWWMNDTSVRCSKAELFLE